MHTKVRLIMVDHIQRIQMGQAESVHPGLYDLIDHTKKQPMYLLFTVMSTLK